MWEPLSAGWDKRRQREPWALTQHEEHLLQLPLPGGEVQLLRVEAKLLGSVGRTQDGCHHPPHTARQHTQAAVHPPVLLTVKADQPDGATPQRNWADEGPALAARAASIQCRPRPAFITPRGSRNGQALTKGHRCGQYHGLSWASTPEPEDGPGHVPWTEGGEADLGPEAMALGLYSSWLIRFPGGPTALIQDHVCFPL